MSIKIKYNLEGNEIRYNSIEDINDYDKVVYIIFSPCSFNELPKLPNLLKRLYCPYNNLTELSELPNSLEELWCLINELTSLPELPNSLRYLDCSDNQLTSLPKLPNSLEILKCGWNDLIKTVKYTYVMKFVY